MPDATERGGALAALYRSKKQKNEGFTRVDKSQAWAEVAKLSELRGDVRSQKGPDVKAGKKAKTPKAKPKSTY